MLPFTLRRDDNTWRARWVDEKLFIVVAGTAEAADPDLLVALADVLGRWPEVREVIATYVAGLADDVHVPLEPASIGGFAAGSCGFDQELVFDSISAPDPSEPDRVEVTFYTGYPDGYATYRVVLRGGRPSAVTAYAA